MGYATVIDIDSWCQYTLQSYKYCMNADELLVISVRIHIQNGPRTHRTATYDWDTSKRNWYPI